MVKNITSLSRSGLSDWLIQRISAVVLAFYCLVLTGYVLTHPDIKYDEWTNLFQHNAFRLFSFLALISLAGHAWVGMWTIGTDYLTDKALGRYALLIRLLFQLLCILMIVVYTVWGAQILWRL